MARRAGRARSARRTQLAIRTRHADHAISGSAAPAGEALGLPSPGGALPPSPGGGRTRPRPSPHRGVDVAAEVVLPFRDRRHRERLRCGPGERLEREQRLPGGGVVLVDREVVRRTESLLSNVSVVGVSAGRSISSVSNAVFSATTVRPRRAPGADGDRPGHRGGVERAVEEVRHPPPAARSSTSASAGPGDHVVRRTAVAAASRRDRRRSRRCARRRDPGCRTRGRSARPASTDRRVGREPAPAAALGRRERHVLAAPPPPPAGPITTIAIPPASHRDAGGGPDQRPERAPVTLRRDETNAATVMIPAAATSATAVAAFGFTDSRTRENANSTTPITASAPSGIRIGSSRLCALGRDRSSAHLRADLVFDVRNLSASQPSVVSSWSPAEEDRGDARPTGSRRRRASSPGRR